MNLTTNSINFNGKKEVLYGLKKAAQEARNIETNRALSQGPRGINKTEEIEKTDTLNAIIKSFPIIMILVIIIVLRANTANIKRSD